MTNNTMEHDSEMNEVPEEATLKTAQKRKKAMIVLGSLFGVLGIIWLIYYLIWGQFKEYTDDAYVTGNMVQLMPQINGTVIEVNADDTQRVRQGQLLIKLDSADYQVALQRAKADLAQTVRQVRQYYDNVAEAQQKLILDQANLLKAELDLKRRKGLIGNRAVSREEMQHIQTAVDAAQANYRVSQKQLSAARALVENADLYHHPLVETAKANLKTAYLNLKRTQILSPVDGYIAKRTIQPGQQVAMNTVMLAIIPLDDIWVDANYKESSLNHIRVNQPVTLYVDAYPDLTYHGKVAGLNAGTGSAFSLLPPQNATGNWIKIVQRLPVRIRLDPQEINKNPLQLGLSMRVTINTHNRNGQRMQSKTSSYQFGTDVYEHQLAEVNTLIAQILRDNADNFTLPKLSSKAQSAF